jgi:hypothetical protein
VVDGTKRKRDKAQLLRAWEEGHPLRNAPAIRKLFSDECSRLREWTGTKAPVFFDFGNGEDLLWVYSRVPSNWAYAAQLSRTQFLASHLRLAMAIGPFDDFVPAVLQLIAADEASRRIHALQWDPLQPRRPRRHFRF